MRVQGPKLLILEIFILIHDTIQFFSFQIKMNKVQIRYVDWLQPFWAYSLFSHLHWHHLLLLPWLLLLRTLLLRWHWFLSNVTDLVAWPFLLAKLENVTQSMRARTYCYLVFLCVMLTNSAHRHRNWNRNTGQQTCSMPEPMITVKSDCYWNTTQFFGNTKYVCQNLF